MRSQTKSSAHAKVAWEHRNSNVDFWTDEEIIKFNINNRSCETATLPCSPDLDKENEVDISHAESQMMNITEALMTHDAKDAASWQMVRETWQWIEGLSRCRSDTRHLPMLSKSENMPVIMEAAAHHLAMADIGRRWLSVLPVRNENVNAECTSGRDFLHDNDSHIDAEMSQLRPDQQRVKHHICGTDKQTLVFVLAGGGVGKTVMINAMDTHFGEGGQLNFAFTGAAAALLPNGRTLTRLFGMKENDNQLKELASLVELVKHLVIDEVSMCPLHILLNVDRRLRKVLNNDLPFGGLKITLVGDFCQLPVIGQAGNNIFYERKWPPFFGAMLETFVYFTDNDFDGNKRSDGCPIQKMITEKMRQMPPFLPGGETVSPGVSTWSESEKELYQPMDESTVDTILTELTDAELIDGFSKLPCHLFCRTNSAKAAYNMKLIERLSAETGQPCFMYRRPIVTVHTQLEACDDVLYNPDRFPELYGVFMEGAPCVLLCNENVSLGLVNGATGTMHKLHWKEPADNVEWGDKMTNAIPGTLFEIKEPSLIFLKIDPHKDDTFWEKRLSTFPTERNVCEPEPRVLRSDPLTKKDIIVGLGHCKTQPQWTHVNFGKEKFNFKAHNVELALAVTPWKSQGRAYIRAMMDMSNAFGGKAIPLEMIYVAFTRVSNIRSIRCLPIRNVRELRKHLLNSRMNFWATRFRWRAEVKSKARRDAEAEAAIEMNVGNNDPPPTAGAVDGGKAQPSAGEVSTNGGDGDDEDVLKWCKTWVLLGDVSCDGVNVQVSCSAKKLTSTAVSTAHRECGFTGKEKNADKLVLVLGRLGLKPEKMQGYTRLFAVRLSLHANAVRPPRIVSGETTSAGLATGPMVGPLQCMLTLLLVPEVDAGLATARSIGWTIGLLAKTKASGVSVIRALSGAHTPPELTNMMALHVEEAAQDRAHLVECARTVISLLLSASGSHDVAMITVNSGPNKRATMKKLMAMERTWDIEAGGRVPKTVAVLVEGKCTIQKATEELLLKSLNSEWGEGSMSLTAVVRHVQNGSDVQAQCFASGRWWEFNGKRTQTIEKPTTIDGYCFFYQRATATEHLSWEGVFTCVREQENAERERVQRMGTMPAFDADMLALSNRFGEAAKKGKAYLATLSDDSSDEDGSIKDCLDMRGDPPTGAPVIPPCKVCGESNCKGKCVAPPCVVCGSNSCDRECIAC